MNSRDRVLRAIKKHDGLPDRVPIHFNLCRKLTDEISGQLGIDPHYCQTPFEDDIWVVSSNELRTSLGSDLVMVGASVSSSYTKNRKVHADGTWLDEFGMTMRRGVNYNDIIGAPLKKAACIDDVKRDYKVLDHRDSSRFEESLRVIEKYKDDYYIFGGASFFSPTFLMLLVGMEKYLTDLATQEEYLDYLIEKHLEVTIEFGLKLIELGVDGLCYGSDFGSQKGLIYSPAMIRDKFLPFYKKTVDAFRKAKPDLGLFFHCCGAAKPVLRDIAEVGFDGYNAVQPFLPGNDPQELKDHCGDVLSFWGGLDVQSIIPNGTDEELEQHIEHYMRVLGKDKGYICSPAHIIQSDTSAKRVYKLIELCKKHSYQYEDLP